MSKFGDGLGIELVRAIKSGRISEPFTRNDVEKFVEEQGWTPSGNYVAVILANSSSPTHSLTYKKYFTSLGNGQYVLSELGKNLTI